MGVEMPAPASVRPSGGTGARAAVGHSGVLAGDPRGGVRPAQFQPLLGHRSLQSGVRQARVDSAAGRPRAATAHLYLPQHALRPVQSADLLHLRAHQGRLGWIQHAHLCAPHVPALITNCLQLPAHHLRGRRALRTLLRGRVQRSAHGRRVRRSGNHRGAARHRLHLGRRQPDAAMLPPPERRRLLADGLLREHRPADRQSPAGWKGPQSVRAGPTAAARLLAGHRAVRSPVWHLFADAALPLLS
mmetsp:Transcript_6819/g.27874  ORF Transcript_6819/g.27874 Transcript_6819/m.27874 type:complete len:245 (+) Transcript_6819:1320-2054(+)